MTNSDCPVCDSHSRYRGLALLLPELLKGKTGDLLVFAPEKVIMDILNQTNVTSQTTDLKSVDVDLPGEDIQELSFADDSFDGILNNHVLEHVPDDRKAVRECYRVLKPGGFALFTLAGDFTKQETEHLFKPDWMGHYRYYGLEVVKLLESAGFHVERIDLSKIADKKHGIRKADMAFLCTKPE